MDAILYTIKESIAYEKVRFSFSEFTVKSVSERGRKKHWKQNKKITKLGLKINMAPMQMEEKK